MEFRSSRGRSRDPPCRCPACRIAAEAGKGPKEDERNLVAGICTTQLAIGDAACSCLADRAINELDQEQLNYLILSVVQPQAAEGSGIAQVAGGAGVDLHIPGGGAAGLRRRRRAAVTPAPDAGAAAPAEGAPVQQ